MTPHTDNPRDHARRNQLLYFAGAVGTTVGIAVWAYSRREPTYWEKTRRAAGKLAESAAEINPWVGAGAGTAALGTAALAYRLKRPKSALKDAGERAEAMVSETGKKLRPGLATIVSASLGIASALYNAKTRKRAANTIAGQASDAADHVAEVGSRIWRRLQTISGEGAKIYPQVRKMMA